MRPLVKTVVSITPLPVFADSRTYRIAASIARFGYRSVVVEGMESSKGESPLPFELVSAGSPPTAPYVGCGGASPGGPLARIPRWAMMPLRYGKAVARFSWEYGLRLARLLPKADLYYLHAPYQFPGVASAARPDAPIVYDAHDLYPVIDPTPFLSIVESYCVRRAAYVVTVSPGLAGLLGSTYGCRPVVIRNVHDLRLDRTPDKSLRKYLGLSPGVFLLVSVGQYKEGMCVDGLFAALRELPPRVHAVFVGKNVGRLEHRVETSGLRGRVHLVPPVRPEEVVPFIKDADAALLPYISISLNYEHCLPNGLFQAVAAGLPLLYPELTDIRALAEEYGFGLPVDLRSGTSVRDAVSVLLEDTSRRTALRHASRVASSSLSWEKEEGILRDLVAGLLGSGEGTG